jgi:pimeloyl-ACP methyl ester carboxylesterase
MYRSASWPAFAQLLGDAESGAPPAVLGQEYARFGLGFDTGWMAHRGDNQPYQDGGLESQTTVVCEDGMHPTSYDAWSAAARTAPGYFGALWTWFFSACAVWPFHDSGRYLGPFDHTTSNPVLIVGNTYDPVTPYESAQHLAALMPNSRLLTMNGWGHSAIANRSQCINQYETAYLLAHQLPPAGTVCEQDHVPFTP